MWKIYKANKGDDSWLPRKARLGRGQLRRAREVKGPTILIRKEMKP